MPLKIILTKTPSKYLESLDRPTKDRIIEKLEEIAADPIDSRFSKSLEGTDKRAARVGKYRILFTVGTEAITVAAIGPRGQIYRTI